MYLPGWVMLMVLLATARAENTDQDVAESAAIIPQVAPLQHMKEVIVYLTRGQIQALRQHEIVRLADSTLQFNQQIQQHQDAVVQQAQVIPHEQQHDLFEQQKVAQSAPQPNQDDEPFRPIIPKDYPPYLHYHPDRPTNLPQNENQYAPQQNNELNEGPAQANPEQVQPQVHLDYFMPEPQSQNLEAALVAQKQKIIELENELQRLKYAPQFNNHEQIIRTNEQSLNKLHSEKERAHAQAQAIANSPHVVVHQDINVVRRIPIQVIKHINLPVPAPYFVPYPKPFTVNIPQPVPVPLEIIRPVPIPVIKTEPVEVERPVPIEVEKHIPEVITKKVLVPVPRPYTVERVVPVEVKKEIPYEIPVHKPQKLTIIRHIWEH